MDSLIERHLFYNGYTLKACVDKMFITDDREEISSLYEGSIFILNKIYEICDKKLAPSERLENDTLPGIDDMTEEQWRMFFDTVE